MTFKLDPALKKTLLEDGVVKIPGMLDSRMLERARACFDWSMEHRGPVSVDASEGDTIYRIENENPASFEFYREHVLALPLAEMLRQAWDSDHIWYHAEENFWKQGHAGRTVWHQDTSYSPFDGAHWANCWMTLDPLPKSHSLEVIRGSHRGTRYDGSAFDPEDPTVPLWGELANLPRLPDIEADRQRDPSSWDVVSFDVEPGDVVVVHPGCLHGGAPVDETMPLRRTLVLRYFGDDAVWTDIPDGSEVLTEEQKVAAPPTAHRGKPGEPYRRCQMQVI